MKANPADIPRIDQPAPDSAQRAVRFRTNPPASGRRGFLRRRGFLGVLSAGAMTLGMTMLGWIPLARSARAEAGTEYPNCGRYSNGPGGPLCIGAPYSPGYCGDDDWFLSGCHIRDDGLHVCYSPIQICRAKPDSNEEFNAWRWMNEGITYRCADGYAYYDGAPNPETLICSARLTPYEPDSTTTPAPPAVPTLPSSSPGLPSLPALPAVPALPVQLPSLPLLPPNLPLLPH